MAISVGCAAVAITMISCSTLSRSIMAPPSIPGSTFVGNDTCKQCHEPIVRDFKTATHARLKAEGKNAANIGCESCHGPGSKHAESGGAPNTIINPKKAPETCFQCHLEVRAKFNLPHHHPLAEGKVSCSDCHNPHKGDAVKGGGTEFMGKNETCFQCHKEQRGPFVYPHEAVRDGCTSCHEPHGSINQRLLTERNAALCVKCHVGAHVSNTIRGTCWSAGCHEAVHGSNVQYRFRY